MIRFRVLAAPILALCLLGESAAGSAGQSNSPTDRSPDATESSTTAKLSLPKTGFGWHQIGYDARYLATRPARFDRSDRKRVYVIGGSAVLLYLLREEIRDGIQDHPSESRTRFLDDVRTMGKGGFAPALALISYGVSLATGSDREKETAVLLLESAAYSAVAATAGSFVLAAERPEDGSSVGFLDKDGRGISVDAALAASVIPVLRRQYLKVRPDDGGATKFWKRTASTLLWTGAALTAYQRLDQDKHWAPDAFLGLATGFGVGRFLCEAHDETAAKRDGRVSMSFNGRGLTLTLRLGHH